MEKKFLGQNVVKRLKFILCNPYIREFQSTRHIPDCLFICTKVLLPWSSELFVHCPYIGKFWTFTLSLHRPWNFKLYGIIFPFSMALNFS